MPLIVEDGTGYANADSLASVAFFRTFHAVRGNTSAAVMSDERVEQLLRVATDYIKYIFGASFLGTKYVSSQSLPFPRYIDGVKVNNPIEVQEATAELALVANSNALMPSASAQTRKRSVKVGPIAVEYELGAGQTFVNGVSRLSAFLGGSASGMTARLIRT